MMPDWLCRVIEVELAVFAGVLVFVTAEDVVNWVRRRQR